MKGRVLVWPLAVFLAAALLVQTWRWQARMEASQVLRRVELLSMAAASAGRAPANLMAANLEALRQVEPLDPLEVGIPIARGTQHLFLAHPEAAIRSYQDSLELEPRPEGYLNLGRAQWLAGQQEEARRSFDTAVRLDRRLAAQIPAVAQ